MKNLTSNYIFNMLFNLMGVVFPIFTFTYALRVIGAEGIGIVQFYESIISYVILFAALGVPIYAVREVSKYRNDKAKFHATVMEILILYLSLSVIGYVVFGLIAIFVPEVNAHWLVFIIMSSELFFDVIGVSWYFNATEDFKYVAIRSFIIRCALLALLFLVVKSKDDFILYVIIHSGTVTLYAVANFWRFWQKEIR
ncbi:MAG: oligosaccharide flippase family protein, partial [Muribaculaceae bacterium]|nr:oligosaccharide flippase family protein [Muribaculaceae bacterium]